MRENRREWKEELVYKYLVAQYTNISLKLWNFFLLFYSFFRFWLFLAHFYCDYFYYAVCILLFLVFGFCFCFFFLFWRTVSPHSLFDRGHRNVFVLQAELSWEVNQWMLLPFLLIVFLFGWSYVYDFILSLYRVARVIVLSHTHLL